MPRSKLAVAAIVLGFSACAAGPTPFQPADPNGYTVTRIEVDRHRLSFDGDKETSPQACDALDVIAHAGARIARSGARVGLY